MRASRTRFNRDQTVLTTFDAGKLIPFYVDEVLPGDTFNVNTAAIIRMTTPKYPVMDDAFIDIYYFYCPNRILWDNFKYFMGEIEATPWMPKKEYATPKIVINGCTSAIFFWSRKRIRLSHCVTMIAPYPSIIKAFTQLPTIRK